MENERLEWIQADVHMSVLHNLVSYSNFAEDTEKKGKASKQIWCNHGTCE